MMPVGPLMIEHRLIERMISLLDNHIKTVSAPVSIDLSLIEKGVDFLRSYADRCHHGKEEDILFTALDSKKLTAEEKTIFDELVAEHKIARATVKSIALAREQALAGNETAFSEIIQLVGKIAVLYPAHIEKEDKRFFIPIMSYFSKDEQDKMLVQFAEFDRQLIHEKYQKVVENLENDYSENISDTTKDTTAAYECSVCGYRYSPALGDPRRGIAGGTLFEELPADWTCPLCGASKTLFNKDSD